MGNFVRRKQKLEAPDMDTLSAIKFGFLAGKLRYREIAARADVWEAAGTLRLFLKYEPRCLEDYIGRVKKRKDCEDAITPFAMGATRIFFPILRPLFAPEN